MAPRPGPAVFAYGTLLPGEDRWPSLAPHALEVVEATAEGRLFDTGRGYPAALFEAGAGPVPGARVAVDPVRWDEVVALLDAVEREGTLYRRVVVATTAGPATSYAWLGPVEGLAPLAHGWRRR